MSKKSVLKEIQERLTQETAKEFQLFVKEKDPIKQMKHGLKTQKITFKIIVDEIKTRSDKDFDKWSEEIMKPFTEQYSAVTNEVDDIMINISKNSKEFQDYKKTQSIKEKFMQDLIKELDDSDLNKKQLQRYLFLLLLGSAQIELQTTKNNVEYNEFWRAITLVQRRLKFDHNWFTCLGLIQIHENLIKKKIVQLEGKINGNEPINVLIDNLVHLIKKKENRDITLDLLMSQSLKKIRDLMTHEGYRHKVGKETLKKIMKEVEELETILYQEKFSIFNL